MPNPDDRIIQLLEALTTCLCGEIVDAAPDEAPIPCLCSPLPGAFPGQAYQGGGEDMAWVRLVNYFPSNTPGVQSNLPYKSAVGRSMLIEVGILRCVEWPADSMFSAEELQPIWEQQMRDLGIMERAIACCTGRTWDDGQFVEGNYVPIGPDANVVGGAISLALQLG